MVASTASTLPTPAAHAQLIQCVVVQAYGKQQADRVLAWQRLTVLGWRLTAGLNGVVFRVERAGTAAQVSVGQAAVIRVAVVGIDKAQARFRLWSGAGPAVGA